MITHPDLHVLVVTETGGDPRAPWPRFGDDMPHVRVDYSASVPGACDAYHAVITTRDAIASTDADRLIRWVHGGGAWLAMIGLQADALPAVFGAQPGEVGPASELRVMFQDASCPMAARLPDAVYVTGRYRPLQTTASDVETLLHADWQYAHSAVLTIRSHGGGRLACTTLQDFSAPALRQVIHRLLRQWQGSAPAPQASMGVGILGYAPSVGMVHGRAAVHTPGFHLRAVCDVDSRRLSQAAVDFPRDRRPQVGRGPGRRPGGRPGDRGHATQYTRPIVRPDDGVRPPCPV